MVSRKMSALHQMPSLHPDALPPSVALPIQNTDLFPLQNPFKIVLAQKHFINKYAVSF